jgi:hypothetical protein
VPECRITIEFKQAADQPAFMRWERAADAQLLGAFTLLGRAFEVARRECDGDFRQALAAFLAGAMIQKEDLAEILPHLDDANQFKAS